MVRFKKNPFTRIGQNIEDKSLWLIRNLMALPKISLRAFYYTFPLGWDMRNAFLYDLIKRASEIRFCEWHVSACGFGLRFLHFVAFSKCDFWIRVHFRMCIFEICCGFELRFLKLGSCILDVLFEILVRLFCDIFEVVLKRLCRLMFLK